MISFSLEAQQKFSGVEVFIVADFQSWFQILYIFVFCHYGAFQLFLSTLIAKSQFMTRNRRHGIFQCPRPNTFLPWNTESNLVELTMSQPLITYSDFIIHKPMIDLCLMIFSGTQYSNQSTQVLTTVIYEHMPVLRIYDHSIPYSHHSLWVLCSLSLCNKM